MLVSEPRRVGPVAGGAVNSLKPIARRIDVARDVGAKMRDGTVLRADVYTPQGLGDCPVLLMRLPYDKKIAQTIVYRHPSWYARYGFQVVVQDTRGRYASDGQFEPYRREAEDGFDSVQWASALGNNTGKVGMYGFSYAGATQLLAASQRPPALVCCAPGFTGSDFFNNWTYDNGCFNLSFVVSWVMQLLAPQDALRTGRRDVAERLARAAADLQSLYGTRPLAEFTALERNGVSDYFFDWVGHETLDEFWESVRISAHYDEIDVPCLHYGGWYDAFSVGTVENYLGLLQSASSSKPAQRLIMGPWTHQSWTPVTNGVNFGPSARNVIDEEHIAWFTYWLRNEGALPRDSVKIYLGGSNAWHDFSEWPPQPTQERVLNLSSAGDANSSSGGGRLQLETAREEIPDVYVYDPLSPVPSVGGRACCNPVAAQMGPAWQMAVESRNDVLVYTSEVLCEPIRLVGQALVVLFASSSEVDTDWFVKITDVSEDGLCSVNVSDGALGASYRYGLESRRPLQPGEVFEYLIRLSPVCWEFAVGHRVRLDVTSSDYPNHLANPNTGQHVADIRALDGRPATQTVFHDVERPSRLVLVSA